MLTRVAAGAFALGCLIAPFQPAQAEEPKADVPGQPARRGWWQRKFGSGS